MEILSKHPRLKELANERREKEIGERLAESKPLEQVLSSIFRLSPSLSALFQIGPRLGNPFKPKDGNKGDGKNGKGCGGTNGQGPGDEPFVGQTHPSFFRFHRKKNGESLVRDCEQGRRCRMTLETDAENEYFMRPENPGSYDVEIIEDTDGLFEGLGVQNSLILHDGLAHWSLQLPDEVEIGQTITLQLTVDDPVLQDPFVNVARLTVRPKTDRPRGGNGNRRSSAAGGAGQQPSGIEMPNIVEVHQNEWNKPPAKFDDRSSCAVVQETDESYTFYINVDNLYLLHELKTGKENPALLKAKFKYGNVLIGLALLQDDKEKNGDSNAQASDESDVTWEDKIRSTTRAIGPFIIPMINYLGALTEEDVASAAQAGDDE